MAYRIYIDSNMLVFHNTSSGKIEKLPRNDIWYTYNTLEAPILYRVYFKNPERLLITEQKGVPYTEFQDAEGNNFSSDLDFQAYFDQLLPEGENIVSRTNSTSDPLDAGLSFTGEWDNVSAFNSVVISVATDQDGTYSIQFSTDGINIDSTLTRYYRTNQIDPPHRFTITRSYARVVFNNTSSSNQTFLRLQTTYGEKSDLNIPLDSTMSQDFDAISVRATDMTTEIALGRRQGAQTWNKFGYNEDIDTANAEVIAEFGGGFDQRLGNAEVLDISSDNAADDSAGTGVRQLVIFGVGGTSASDRNDIVDVIAMDGTNTVTSNLLFWGVNRMTIFQSGSSDSNVGTITADASVSGNTMATMPAGQGTTQQMIFYVPEGHQFLATWLYLEVVKQSGGGSPIVNFRGYVYSEVVGSQFEIFRDSIDLSNGEDSVIQLNPGEPFVIGESSILWFEAETTSNNTSVRGRFSGKLFKDVDG